jgi:hypothetical protein
MGMWATAARMLIQPPIGLKASSLEAVGKEEREI